MMSATSVSVKFFLCTRTRSIDGRSATWKIVDILKLDDDERKKYLGLVNSAAQFFTGEFSEWSEVLRRTVPLMFSNDDSIDNTRSPSLDWMWLHPATGVGSGVNIRGMSRLKAGNYTGAIDDCTLEIIFIGRSAYDLEAKIAR